MSRLLVAILGLYAAVPLARPVRVADQSCQRCHQQIYREYLQTPMANASGPASERLLPGHFDNQSSGMKYRLDNAGGRATLAWEDVREPGTSGQWSLSYFLGSGHLGTTWLYTVNEYLFESPVAWYAASHGYDMKPGLAGATNVLPALPMQSECMRCHMSAVQPSDAGTTNRYTEPPFLHTGITCEACHGDAQEHVLSRGKAKIVNPAKLDAEKRDSICIDCHLEGDVTVERAGRSALDYRPGDSISDFLAYYVYTRSDPLARGVSEVEQFNQSMCKRISGDHMSCTTCHNPHFTPSAKQQVSYYRSKCLTCHGNGSFVQTHHPENPDCIGCHMPHNGAQNIPHVAWTDHRILRHPETDTQPRSETSNVLAPLSSPSANQRDLGVAYYLAYLKGNREDGRTAWQILSSQRQQINGDEHALDALGLLDLQRGDYPEGEACFRRVLALDAKDLTAQSNLGILLAKKGKLDESLRMLQSAFDRNLDVVGLAMNLARVQCIVGDVSGVQNTLRSSLVYNPGVESMLNLLRAAESCRTSGSGGSAP